MKDRVGSLFPMADKEWTNGALYASSVDNLSALAWPEDLKQGFFFMGGLGQSLVFL